MGVMHTHLPVLLLYQGQQDDPPQSARVIYTTKNATKRPCSKDSRRTIHISQSSDSDVLCTGYSPCGVQGTGYVQGTSCQSRRRCVVETLKSMYTNTTRINMSVDVCTSPAPFIGTWYIFTNIVTRHQREGTCDRHDAYIHE